MISERLNTQYREDLADKLKSQEVALKTSSYQKFMLAIMIAVIENFIHIDRLDNDEECQFSITEILSDYEGEGISYKTTRDRQLLAKNIKTYFGDQVNVIEVPNDIIICFQGASSKILTDHWYTSKHKNPAEERKRIVEKAGEILFDDIKSKFYDLNNYPAPEFFLDETESAIPATLQILLNVMINSNKKSVSALEKEKWRKRIITIAHIIIYAVRPRSFSSSILLGLSTMLHKKHGSKNLIDTLAHLGLCSSYSETLLFEASIVSEPQNYNTDDSYIQCIFDNADHNTATIDGHNTFHSMGGIICATPANTISCQKTIPRLKRIPWADTIGKFGFIPVKHFGKPKKSDLKCIIIRDVDKENPIPEKSAVSTSDVLWFYGKYLESPNVGGWNSFMEIVTPLAPFDVSKIIPLPFVNAIPSDYDTIFTVLLEANKKCVAQNQSRIAVTFDQPLYQKSFEILTCCVGTHNFEKINRVFVRLGGFHFLMSYLIVKGYVMDGSGLKELFCELLAEASAAKALNGHAYSRALRGHILVQAALAKVIFSTMNIPEYRLKSIAELIVNADNDPTFLNNAEIQNLAKEFSSQMECLANNGPTARLWIQYFQMVNLSKQFIQAERTGDFHLHLQCVQEMLPYFHAAGHNNYAKSGHLYWQDMVQLESTMDATEFNKFTRMGYFTVRRTDKFRSGTWTDMIIEQVLMRSLKVSGGITHGRGQTESVLCKWTLSSIVLMTVTDKLEQFCNVKYSTSHQHVDASNSRMKRDESDMKKLDFYLQTHNPFPLTDNIISISTGVVGDNRINCFKAAEIGKMSMQNVIGRSLEDVKFQRKNKVLPLSAINSSILVGDKVVNIDPAAIFQKASLSVECKDDMKCFLKYELSTYPLSLFDSGGLRKCQKSLFYSDFDKTTELETTPSDYYVIDGGFLLHKVRWNAKSSIHNILQSYVTFARRYTNCSIVFDGYSEICTKSVERLRRQNVNLGHEVEFDRNTVISQTQDKFLNNEKNKMHLIQLLCQEFETNNVSTQVAQNDADCLIVESGIRTCILNSNCNTFIVGEDDDLLVILQERARQYKNIFLLKPGRGNENDSIYNSCCFKISKLQHLVGFVHAMTGCDTTSALFNQGKHRLIAVISDDINLQALASNFYLSNASATTISQSGMKIIAQLYGAKEKMGLNELRFILFRKAAFKTSVKLEKLPPTEGSAVQHCLRVFLQVQEWLGVRKDPTKWGWILKNSTLLPVHSNDPMIPEELASKISCKCKKGCKTKACTCRKNGFTCTEMCGKCQTNTENICTNMPKEVEDILFDDFDNNFDNDEIFDDYSGILGDREWENDFGDKHSEGKSFYNEDQGSMDLNASIKIIPRPK